MAKKAKTKDEKLHMRAVADLGCIFAIRWVSQEVQQNYII